AEFPVAVAEPATNVRVSRALAQDVFNGLVCRTLHTRRAATATLFGEQLSCSAASSTKAQQGKHEHAARFPLTGGVRQACRLLCGGLGEELGRGVRL
ncbi:hypothetical protein MRX96_053635, partial [Rhipicephalus microplus]